MPFCPNPACRHRELTGDPAEYRTGVERCVDCGAALVEDDPSPAGSVRRLRRRCPRHLARRLWLTLAIVGGLLAIVGAPVAIERLGLFELFDIRGELPAALASGVLQIGIEPFVFGFVAVEIFALIVPALRRRRLGDPLLRRYLRIAALITGSAVALFQGYGIGSYVEAVFYFEGSFDAFAPYPFGPGLAFRLVVSLIAAGGASLWVLAAGLVDRHGVGRGFAVMLIVQIIAGAPALIAEGFIHWRTGALSAFSLLVAGAIPVLAIVGLHLCFRLGDRLAGDRPFALPTCGTAPLEAGLVPLAAAGLFVSLFYVDGLAERLTVLTPGSPVYLATLVVTCAALAFPFSAVFNWRRRRGLASGEGRQAWLQARLLSAAAILALPVGDHLLARWLHGPAISVLPSLLSLAVAYALVADWWTEVRARWRATDGLELQAIETHQDVGDALEAARRLAGDDAYEAVCLTGLRFRSLAYFFGPYVPLVVLGGRRDESAD